MTRSVRIFILTSGLAAALWLIGLVLFAVEISLQTEIPGPTEETDAIVVLTGGSERIAAGLELLAAHKGKKLFISGVHPGSSLDQLLGGQKIDKDLRACCIVLGHTAETTFGNAEETHGWMDAEHYKSLSLVTANYHMPRSLLIFRAVMPDFEIAPHPIAPESVKLEDWWRYPGTASLLATEYDKYLFAQLRLWLGIA